MYFTEPGVDGSNYKIPKIMQASLVEFFSSQKDSKKLNNGESSCDNDELNSQVTPATHQVSSSNDVLPIKPSLGKYIYVPGLTCEIQY